MRVLVVGSGGREHALCWKLAQSPSVEKVFSALGNPGIAEVAQILDISPLDDKAIVVACKGYDIDLVVFGPEKPLIIGVADRVRESGVKVYGPRAACARIEGSKAFSKRLMQEEGIPTAQFASFAVFEDAKAHIEQEFTNGRQVVVKASGDALGKGVIVCDAADQAIEAARRMLVEGDFGEAGKTVVIEERLTGPELSLLAVCSGPAYRVLPSARDYKSAYDGGKGPNTGGMGAISPAPDFEESDLANLGKIFIQPVLDRFHREGTPYVGTLFCGLMLTEDVGSSRVDLQACKLEYSIVSPK